MPVARRTGLGDPELARRAAAGDAQAFTALDDRYRRPLTRYARRLLRRSEHDAEDVVQEVLIRAHAALERGDGPDDLRPWLYRLTRNRAIDEVRRARWGETELPAETGGTEEDPAVVLNRRESVRRLVEDLAALPQRQRDVLLSLELDGDRPDAVAAELGLEPAAVRMHATRARQGLVKARAARDADCDDVRAELAAAHDRGVRPSEHARRHLAGCAPCRAYARDLKRLSRRLGLLAPPPVLAPLAALAKLIAGGGAKAPFVVGALVVAVAGGGVAVSQTHLFSSGQPAPFSLHGDRAILGHAVTTGAALPGGTAVVTAQVRVPAGPRNPARSVTLTCPAGTRVEGLAAPEKQLGLGFGLAASTAIGSDRTARIDFDRRALARPVSGTVGVVCHRLSRGGSLALHPRAPRPGETPARVCADRVYLRYRPGGAITGTVFRDEPVAVQRTSAGWARVVSDFGSRGWLRKRVLRAGATGPRC